MSAQEIYIFILNSNLINFILMVWILAWVFKKFNLGSIIDSLADDIKNNVLTSAESVQKAIDEYKMARKDFKNTNSKKEAILSEAKNMSLKLEEKNNILIENKKNKLDINNKKLMDNHLKRQTQKTTAEIENAIYTLSIDTIKNLMTDEVQKSTIINCLDEFDNMEGGLK